MGGFFGVAAQTNCVYDLFFGTDYHSHLGTRRGGLCVYNGTSFKRSIHNIEAAPFRTKFEKDIPELDGNMGIGCISDMDPQPILIAAAWGSFALTTVGRINNIDELSKMILQEHHGHFFELSGGKINATELVAALIATKNDLVEGIRYAQELIDGSMSILALTTDALYAARDKLGRTPIMLGHKEGAYCVSFENFAYFNLGYQDYDMLGPGEIVKITPTDVQRIQPPGDKCRICAFLWTYFGYPNSSYEGVNVEEMRYRCGSLLAAHDQVEADSVSGVPDSGIAHAVGYANRSKLPFTRPLVKYTPTWPRSFMPQDQNMRHFIAKMKLVPVDNLIRGKKLLLVDDSVVRGTQMSETVSYLYENGAKEVHIRPACPPILFGCKYLNFSRSTTIRDLIARRVIEEREGTPTPPDAVLAKYLDPQTEEYQAMEKRIAEVIGVDSIKFQRLDHLIESIGLPADRICTYCWNGKE